jgi:hypothetical protein
VEEDLGKLEGMGRSSIHPLHLHMHYIHSIIAVALSIIYTLFKAHCTACMHTARAGRNICTCSEPTFGSLCQCNQRGHTYTSCDSEAWVVGRVIRCWTTPVMMLGAVSFGRGTLGCDCRIVCLLISPACSHPLVRLRTAEVKGLVEPFCHPSPSHRN